MATGLERDKEGVPDVAFLRASRQAAVGFHVANLGFDSALAAEVDDQLGGQTAPFAAYWDEGSVLALATIAMAINGPILGTTMRRRAYSLSLALRVISAFRVLIYASRLA